ncbi:Uncharacterised protein [Mycobacteroides abscessus subsp. abscessus]|nr:Uncharacterised protein [Mycobacteroides abscessus subsp. abscessus]
MVATDSVGLGSQDAVLAAIGVDITKRMPDMSVPGHQRNGALLTAATDQDGDRTHRLR